MTTARARCFARRSSTCDAGVSGCASPRYQNGPSSRAARLLERRGAGLVEVAGQLAPYRLVDLVTRQRRDGRTDAAVHEQHAVDLHDTVQRPQPLAVRPLAPERDAHLDGSERRFLQQLLALLRRCRLDEPLPDLFRSGGGERRVLAWRREPQIAEHAHDLVIPQQRVHGAARARGVLAETLEQVERLPRVRTAVDDIAQLDEMRFSGRPPQPGVDDLRRTENRDQPIVGAMHIADGDDALDAVDLAGRGGSVQATAGAGITSSASAATATRARPIPIRAMNCKDEPDRTQRTQKCTISSTSERAAGGRSLRFLARSYNRCDVSPARSSRPKRPAQGRGRQGDRPGAIHRRPHLSRSAVRAHRAVDDPGRRDCRDPLQFRHRRLHHRRPPRHPGTEHRRAD